MNYILGGGGLSSRLADAIRNKRGLAYSVYSRFSARRYVGTFRVSMQTKNESAQEAIRIVKEEIRRIREQGVTEKELQEAKDYLTGSFPLRLDTNRRVARFLAQVEFLGLGLDYVERYPGLIRQVSREDIIRVARTHLRLEDLIVVVVANLEKAGFRN
jgi:zinc protease